MLDKQWQDVESTVAALAADSILIQQRLDDAVAQQRAQFAALLATVPTELQSLMAPLCPPALVVQKHTIRCTLRVTTTRTAAFSLVAAPIHAGYHALYQTTQAEQCSLSIEVRAVSNVDRTPLQESRRDDGNPDHL